MNHLVYKYLYVTSSNGVEIFINPFLDFSITRDLFLNRTYQLLKVIWHYSSREVMLGEILIT